MLTRRFGTQLLQILADKEKIRAILNAPITADMCLETHPLTLLADRLLMWPTYDIRYMGISGDTRLIRDIVSGMENNIIRKDLTSGIVEMSVEVQENLAEYEKFNHLTEQHNTDWIRNGRKTHVIDPVHGDLYEVADQLVDPALIGSRHNPVPDGQINDSVQRGRLSQMRPQMRRRTFATVRYQLRMSGEMFILGYAAYSSSNEVVYYGEQSHYDLAVLIRKSVQEIWGNPYEQHEAGKLLEGISLLTQGRKLNICKRDNKLPNFLSSLEIKSGIREVDIIEGKQNICKVSNKLFGIGVPVLSFFLVILIFLQLVDSVNNGTLNGTKILLEILIIITAVITGRFVSRWSERQASILDAEKSLL